MIWTNLGLHAGALHTHTRTQKVRPGFYDFSMPVLTAAGTEEIFIASELFFFFFTLFSVLPLSQRICYACIFYHGFSRHTHILSSQLKHQGSKEKRKSRFIKLIAKLHSKNRIVINISIHFSF